MDGWKMNFLLGRPIFRGCVSVREGSPLTKTWWAAKNLPLIPPAKVTLSKWPISNAYQSICPCVDSKAWTQHQVSFDRFWSINCLNQNKILRDFPCNASYAGFQKMGVSKNRGKKTQNGCFIMENPIKIDNLGAHPYFWKHLNVWEAIHKWMAFLPS